MNQKAIESLELNKILADVASFAVLNGTKEQLCTLTPDSTVEGARERLRMTTESDRLIFRLGVGRIEYFDDLGDSLIRAKKGATLSCAELLVIGGLLRSSRLFATSVHSLADDSIVLMRRLSERISFDLKLEDDISSKIISDAELSDFASDKLHSLRIEIRRLNERIRNRLSEYLSGTTAQYLQDSIVTMRNDRYVLPVKAEYKRNVRGFVHDRSASGATVFIEPEHVLEMNNELRSLYLDEKEEVERILAELSASVGRISDRLLVNVGLLYEADGCFARAEYAYKRRCTLPVLNEYGNIKIRKGRHPLIDAKKVVPVSVELGEKNRFLLISGPNTGGKTVTMKMCGLFCLMAMCGLYIPASEGSEVSVFDEIYCDIGDAQSIEADLSTFSSHVSNLIQITNSADRRSLVLIDELGGGTDPDEGQALARAIIGHFLKLGCKGIVTTHYSSLKEFAYGSEGIVNACMEFDSSSLRPLFNIKIGLPGSSNALAISRRLGLSEEILNDAMQNLSEGAQKYEQVLQRAEESRVLADGLLRENKKLEQEWLQKLAEVEQERIALKKERDKLLYTAKAEAKRIIAERTARAEELLAEMELKYEQEGITQADITSARTLKNRIADISYTQDADATARPNYSVATLESLEVGSAVYLESAGLSGTVQELSVKKKQAVVSFGGMTMHCKISDLKLIPNAPKPPVKKKEDRVTVVRKFNKSTAPMLEVNVIGMTVSEALPEVDALIDGAIASNLSEVKIIHGAGTGRLREGIAKHLRLNPHVASFRLGNYGEGQTGVTIVKIK